MTNFDFETPLKVVERAARTAENAMSGSRTYDGKPMFPPAEMVAKQETALKPLRAAVQEAYDVADAAQVEADVMSAASFNDPLNGVSNETLQRMGLLSSFIREEIADMMQIGLADRLRGVLQHGDDATRLLYLRYAKVNPDQPGAQQVATLLRELDDKVNGPSRAETSKALKASQKLRSDAIGLRMSASQVLGKADGSIDRRHAQIMQDVGGPM